MAKYNGHKSWAYWNVSLWIGNDEGLYNLAKDSIRYSRNRDEAAKAIVSCLNSSGMHQTPDGANYSVSAVRAAITGF